MAQIIRTATTPIDLVRVFWSPIEVLQRVVREPKPRWLMPLSAPMLLGAVIVVLAWPKYQEFILNATAPAVVTNPGVAIGLRANLITSLISNWTIGPGMALIGAALVATVYGFLTSYIVDFKRLFTLAVWASVPETLGSHLVAGTLTLALSLDELLKIKGPPVSLAVLAYGMPKWLTALFWSVDLFYLWFLVLFTAGFALAVQRPVRSVIGLPMVLFCFHALFIAIF